MANGLVAQDKRIAMARGRVRTQIVIDAEYGHPDGTEEGSGTNGASTAMGSTIKVNKLSKFFVGF